MQPWQLPEYISDILPARAQRIESAKEALLSLYRRHGYALVRPPLVEYTESLLTEIDSGLALKTVQIVDQLSGRQLGIRADTTPQIARIDAHLLAHNHGINRLCYVSNTVHARPDTLMTTREPLQVGAELYGCSTIESDIEVIDLMIKSLGCIGVNNITITLGHIAIFQSLIEAYHVKEDDEQSLRLLLQNKNYDALLTLCCTLGLPEEIATLSKLYGHLSILEKAQKALPPLKGIQVALNNLKHVVETLQTQNNTHNIHIDLATSRSDHYHTGLLFSAYATGFSSALASGGRYDGLGTYFGRTRPATGFSFDLKNFLEVLPQPSHEMGICVSIKDWALARPTAEALRLSGETVIINYLDESPATLNCNRCLKFKDNQWVVVPI